MRPIILSVLASYPTIPGRFVVNATYDRAVRDAGGTPLFLGRPELDTLPALLDLVDGVLIMGGADIAPELYGVARTEVVRATDEQRDAVEFALIREARARSLPLFGICRGHQLLSVAFGGKLSLDITHDFSSSLPHDGDPSMEVRGCIQHTVTIEPRSKLATIIKTPVLPVNSLHHEAIVTLGDGLRIAARAPDGIIEAIEDPTAPFVFGVQWHPEELQTEESAALFGAFIDAARDARSLRTPA